MTRVKTLHRCRACGVATARWAGRCPGCGEWNTLDEQEPCQAPPTGYPPLGRAAAPVALTSVQTAAHGPRPTGLAELDRVLGGGLVPGSATLLGGEPGVGKSTLLLQVLCAHAASGSPALLVCAEESPRQVRLRAERLGPLPDHLLLLPGTDVAGAAAAIESSGAGLVVVDSVQAVRDPSTAGPAGSVAQVRACAEMLTQLAKRAEVAVVLLGHVTKDGGLAGPRLLEHVVDTVLTLEGDRHHALRVVRAVKHRFGATGEVGLFEMGEGGLDAVTDPHRLLLGDRRPEQPGSVVLPAMEGQRALLVEVQALVSDVAGGAGPRRQAQGLDAGRLAMLLGVLEVHVGCRLAQSDVFTSVVGGLRVCEPAADLALVLALASSARRRPVPADLVALGEVGLGGEVRHVPHSPSRLAEAARLGFRYALVPKSSPDGPLGLRLLRVGDAQEAAALLER